MVFIKKIIRAMYNRFVWGISSINPINKKKIVVCSFYGKGYGDNPKYIIDLLLKQKEDLQVIWLLSKKEDATSLPNIIKPCRINSLRAIYHLATAKIWIDNCRKYCCLKKKKQVYIQTWHGFALKRIEKDVEEHLSTRYVKNAIKDAKNTDLMISDSKFMTQIYQSAFWYNGEIVEWGSPRNDIFFENKDCQEEKVKLFYNIEKNKKIVLYAPTFRANQSLDAYGIDYDRLRRCCEKRFGGEFVVLLRLHPNLVAKYKELIRDGKAMINATNYPDMQELLNEADVVISDYSSLMFDFALSKKPCIQFATDIEEYKKDRNFYFEIDKLPFPLSTNNDELEEVIAEFDIEKYQRELDAFFDNVGMVREGKASLLCAEWILKRIG